LDRLGVLLGRPRSNSTTAFDDTTTNVIFSVDPVLGTDISGLVKLIDPTTAPGSPPAFSLTAPIYVRIPQGTRLSKPDTAIEYVTTQEVLITMEDPDKTTSVGVPVIATAPGDLYNVSGGELSTHNLDESQPALQSISKYILCTNTQDIVNGFGVESDDNYRYFLSKQVNSAEAANEAAIRIAALAVPGVSDIYLRRWTYGIGTFSVHIVSTTPVVGQGLINAVSESVGRVAAYPEKFTVAGPDYIGVKLVVGLTFIPSTTQAERDGLVSSAARVVVDYINNIELGGSLIINEIIQRVMDLSDKILDTTLTDMNLGRYNIKLNKLEYLRPVIIGNQKAGTHQKFYTTFGYIVACAN
jgi:hypothetical protein